MRKSLFIPFVSLFFVACNTNNTKTSETESPKTPVKDNLAVDPPKIISSGLILIPFKFSDKNCDLVAPEDMELDEGWCNSREINGLRVSLTDAAIAQKINYLICKEISGKPGNLNTLKKFVSEISSLNNEEGDMEYIQDEYTCSLIDSSNTYLSMGISSYFYSMGSAHGQPGIQVLNVDLKSGKKIVLSDLFVNNYRPTLKAFAKRKFLEQNGNGDWWFITGEQVFDLPETFAISRKGITFTYQPYEIGPYAAGAPEIFLSKRDLSKWLRENPYLIPLQN